MMRAIHFDVAFAPASGDVGRVCPVPMGSRPWGACATRRL